MNDAFYQSVAKSTAHRPIRDYHVNLVFENPELFDDLMQIALNTNDQNHHKACWILELVLEQKLNMLVPYLDVFCETLPQFTHDGSIRSVSKICQFAATRHLKTKAFVTELQVRQITEKCFDWLITDAKVASKAYAMRSLLELGKLQDWVYPELQSVLEMGYPDHSPAYQAASREVLKKIKLL